MLVTFLKTRTPDGYRQGIDPLPRYEAGQTYDLPREVAEHWIARGAAVAVRGGVEAPVATAPEVVNAIEIAPDWRSASADGVKALAASITGTVPKNRSEAEGVIEAEIERRAAAAA